MENNSIIIEKDLFGTIMSLPDTEEKRELIAYLVAERIKGSIEGDQVQSDTLKVNVSINNNGYFSIFFKNDGYTDLEEDFKCCLFCMEGNYYLADVKRDLIEKMAGVNELGAEIYKVFRDCERHKSEEERRECTYYFRYDTTSPIRIPAHLIPQIVKVEYVEEIAEFVANYLAKLFLEYFKTPEVHERLATYEIPESVKVKLRERGVDPTFRIEYYAEKERGLGNLELYMQAEVSDKLRNTLSFLLDHKLTRNFVQFNIFYAFFMFKYIDPENYPLTIFSSLQLPDNSDRMLLYKLLKYEYLKYDVLKIIKEIKQDLNRRFRSFNEYYKCSNLFLAAMYKSLDYTAPTIEIPLQESILGESKSILIQNLHIERKFLFDDVHIQFNVKVPNRYRIERLLIDFNTVEGKRHMRINVSERTKKTFSMVIKADRRTVSNRMSRLIDGDASVIDEVEEVDQKLIGDITAQLRQSIVDKIIKDEREEREMEERERKKREELNNILVGG